jgi:hypothetical protein
MDKDDIRAQLAGAGGTPDAARASHAGPLIQSWSRLGRQLVPLIGEGGFVALFTRSVRLLAPPRPWLSTDPARKSSALLLAALEHDLASVDGAQAQAAHEELMSAFVRQLTALIGPALTARLLAELATGDARHKNQEEHKQ